MMNSYLIESLAPLVFRSGKPFGSQASAQDVVFPLPSAGAGLVRALSIGQQKLTFDEHELKPLKKDGWQKVINHESYQNVLSIRSRGVFLMRLPNSGKPQLLVPKPTNALYLEKKDQETPTTELVRLSPKPFAEGCGSDLPKGLLPLQMEKDLKGKPKSGASFWTLEHLIQWQENDESPNYEDVNQQGLTTIPIELRTHVAIDDETESSEDGKLFQTASFDLGYQAKSEDGHQLASGWENHRYAFMVQTEQDLQEDFATFGGERRLSYFKRLEDNPLARDNKTLLRKINEKKGFCLTLLTPAIFGKGYLPQWIDDQTFTGTLPNSKVEVKLVATAIDRWQAVSGWDSILWQPKATRKAVSAGAVYWFECLTDMDEHTLDYLTNTALSDHEQDSRDGFGVALITAWQASK